MHGLINRAVQCFVRDTYGPEVWVNIVRRLDLGFDNFEALFMYEDALTYSVLDLVCEMQAKPRDALLEDIGTYLVSHPNVEALRRLLRFGGDTFEDFLQSLDDLPDRARLAVQDLELPSMAVRSHTSGTYSLFVRSAHPGFGHLLVGILQAMADDYGALVLLEFQGRQDDLETISINLLDVSFAEGRSFELSRQVG